MQHVNKKKQANSQFIRAKLEEQYNPKLKIYKPNLYKFKKDQNKILDSIKFKQQQNIICFRALDCFRKGEKINIDWNTKSNFRKNFKTQETIFPSLQISKSTKLNERCKTQQYLDYQTKNNFSKKVYNSLQKLNQKSRKSTSQIRKKLFFLHRSLKDNTQSISSKILKSKSLKSSKVNIANDQNLQKYYQNQLKQDHKISIEVQKNQKQKVNYQRQNTLKQIKRDQSNEDQFDFSNIRSLTDNQIKIIQQSSLSQFTHNRSLTQKSMQFSTKLKQIQDNKSNECSMINDEIQDGDIFQNTQILKLISKSRDKIIHFKQKIEFQSLTKFEKLKSIQKKKLSKLKPFLKTSKQTNYEYRNKNLNNSQNCNQDLSFFNSNQQIQNLSGNITKKGQIYEQQQKHNLQNNLKHSKYIKNNKQYDEFKKIEKFSRDLSINQIQERIIKSTKLKLLRQDLIQKFHQIRILNNSN